MKRLSIKFRLSFAVLFLFHLGIFAAADAQQVIRGHVPSAISKLGLQPIGRMDSARQLRLAIGLPLRNQQSLTLLLKEMYDPASPSFRQYLTTEQFTDRFCPTEQDYQAVVSFAEANGLTVAGTHRNRMLLDVSGSVFHIERAFHVRMNVYQHPVERRTFFAPDAEPTVPSGLEIIDVSGLNNYARTRPALHSSLSDMNKYAVQNGSAPTGDYWGNDFRAAYAPNVSLNGNGQIVGIVAFDGYTQGDITQYEAIAPFPPPAPNVTLQNVLVDGFNGISTGTFSREVTTDIEMAISMAPGLSKVLVYEAPPDSELSLSYVTWHDLLSSIANDNIAKQISCSFQIPIDTYDAFADQIFQQMAVQGQSFFVASGDGGKYNDQLPNSHHAFPQGSDYVTDVGGTVLGTNGPGGNWTGESAWSLSGGGTDPLNPIPSYQQNVNMGTNGGSTTVRNIPDVAMVSLYTAFYYNNQADSSSGTSFSAPLWAGFAALINQQAVAAGKPTVGFLNPIIYLIGNNPTYYARDFHDIVIGNNGYPAVTGYDLCTGWGTPTGQNTINDIISLNSFSASVDQKLNGGTTSVDSIARWVSTSFNKYAAGTSFTFYLGRNEVLRGAQKTISGQKYNYWSVLGTTQSNVTNHHLFNIQIASNNYFLSNFAPTYNATLQAQFIEGGSPGGIVNFNDPWRIDTTDSYGKRNQGMSDWARPISFSQNDVGVASPDSGVFLNESGPNSGWTPPYYSVSAPSTQPMTVSGQSFTGIFEYWTGTNATLQSPTSTTSPVVFTNSGATVIANYKGIHLSNDPSAFTDNSSKKLVETAETPGVLHQVYSSSIGGVSHVWYETSTNQGTTWTIMNNGQPLDGTNGGKCPSIAVNNVFESQWGYAVAIVFQQQGSQGGQSGSTFTIQVMNFFQNYNNYNTPQVGTATFSEHVDSYSTTNANPNILWVDYLGDFFMTWERKNADQTNHYKAGINYIYGLLTFGYAPANNGTPCYVTGTDANSINASIACNNSAQNSWGYDYAFHLAWEEYVSSMSSSIYWCVLQDFWSQNIVTQYAPRKTYPYINISQPSYYVLNVRPSVIALTDTNAMVWWTGDKDGHGTYYNVNVVGCDPSTHTAFYFSGAAVRSVSTNSAGNTSNYYVAYSQNYPSSNWYNRAAPGSAIANFVTLSTTGQDIQLSNGASSSNMFVSSYNSSSLPYYFSTSQSLHAGGLSKENSYREFSIRGISFKEGALGFSYSLGDLVVDGNSIDFVDAPDSTDYGVLSNVNRVFETKPFTINSNSNFTFTENSGFADSIAVAQMLGTSGYISYRVDLVDNATNAVIGTIRDTTLKSSNATLSSVIPYTLNTNGVGSRTVRVRITHTTNLDSVTTALMKGYETVNPADGLAKSSMQEGIMIGLDIPTSYALNQNFPNPFNPTTTISYQIPKDGPVTIKIFDALGREVTTLVDEFKSAGQYSVKFDASHLSTGIYFYSIKSGDFNAVKKMALIK